VSSSRRRHTRFSRDWSSDVCSSDSKAAGHTSGKRKLRDKLPLRVVDELESSDPLLEAQVIQLPGAKGVRMTVVVHGQPDATPEQIQEALIAWRKAERNLHRLPDEDDEDSTPKKANGA